MDEGLTNVLLESGTNELEIMEFLVDNKSYGINVAKVIEIMQYSEIMPMPNSNIFVEGVFKPRDEIITVVDLAKYLGLKPSPEGNKDILIITKFNNMSTAFHVQGVVGINRISWEAIEKPSDTIYGTVEAVATGIAKFKDKLITIVDFEKIVMDINPDSAIKSLNENKNRGNTSKPILLAEDSPILRQMLVTCLREAGFEHEIICTDGKDAMEKIEELRADGSKITDKIKCIITDIEMPQMDGHRLTKIIKEDPELREIPVIIFSSLINDEMRIKGESIGADAQITKPEINKLVEVIDELILD